MKSVSDKQRAKRLAAGERFIGSSIAPKPVQPQPSSGYCPIRRKRKVKKAAKQIAKRGPGKAKREARNAAYYKSAEWRAKRKAVFARDCYRCTERSQWEWTSEDGREHMSISERCPNRGEIVNGKQTGRGLVAEEKSYFHRDKPENIDRIVTRCKDCDRRLTPLERINHSHGFKNQRG